ncbi:hypothetical protein, partial [Halorubrum lacusprofundi]|uniref:hypothetical protein n=1 Tax=Halorubrum lacusprofundi TaxID=2247 RepID=UPI00197AD687
MVIDSVASGVGASAASVFDIPSVRSRAAKAVRRRRSAQVSAMAIGSGVGGGDRRPVWSQMKLRGTINRTPSPRD